MIGLISCFEVYNYGSQLMSYAMQRELDQLGCKCEHINYVPIKDLHYFASLPFKLMNKQLRQHKISDYEEERIQNENKERAERFKKKIEAFDIFVKRYIRKSKAYVGYSSLKKACANYDGFVLGSDQVWGPMNLEGDFKNMIFIPADMPKIAYGASFGVNEIPSYQKIRTKKYLKRIQHISVREIQGAEIIKGILGEDTKVVLDPTLLFTINEWNEIANRQYVPEEQYIFVYFLGKKRGCRNQVKKLKEKTGYKVIAIDMYPYDGEAYADEYVDDAAPDDFVSLISNAAYVCTDSFHGTVFSILSERHFVTFLRDTEDKTTSANSRVESLLKQLGILERLCHDNEDILLAIDNPIDYSAVNRKLSRLRRESQEYLVHSLKSEGLL